MRVPPPSRRRADKNWGAVECKLRLRLAGRGRKRGGGVGRPAFGVWLGSLAGLAGLAVGALPLLLTASSLACCEGAPACVGDESENGENKSGTKVKRGHSPTADL